MRETIELYKKEIEIFLSTLSIFKGSHVITSDTLNVKDKEFIKKKFTQIKNGNVNEETLNVAIEELLPYLYRAKN